VSPEIPNETSEPAGLTEDEMREILDAAERRKDAEWKSKSRVVSRLIIIPTLILVVWAAVFLIRYQPTESSAPPKTASPAASAESELLGKEDLAVFEAFRPKDPSKTPAENPTSKPPGSITIGGKTLEKSDVEFISQLLHFSEAADKPEPKR
jgi:cytoskeletal protein RodZ